MRVRRVFKRLSRRRIEAAISPVSLKLEISTSSILYSETVWDPVMSNETEQAQKGWKELDAPR